MAQFLFEEQGSSTTSYPKAAVADGLVFAVVTALDPGEARLVPEADSVAAETRLCLSKLEGLLSQAGCRLEDVVKVNCYLADDAFRTDFWQTWDATFPDLGGKVVRITHHVPGLEGDARVMLDAIAVQPN